MEGREEATRDGSKGSETAKEVTEKKRRTTARKQ